VDYRSGIGAIGGEEDDFDDVWRRSADEPKSTSYGRGVVFGDPLPPNFCGGRVAMRVMLTTPLGQLPGILTVICVIGPNPPNSIISNGDRSEGATLNVPGVINFNHTAGGENIIIQNS
jgi:hypothetical protein